jgi:outer membrane protein
MGHAFMNRLMHSHLVFLVALLTVIASPLTLAQTSLKIGFVNVGRVLDKAPQAEAARNRIEREFAPRDRKLLDQQKLVRAEEDRLVKNAAVMSASERQRKEAEVRALKRELRRSQDEFREDLNLRRSQELNKLQRKVAEVIQGMAKAEKYDLVMTDGVIFAGDRIEFTAKVIERLKSEFKGG